MSTALHNLNPASLAFARPGPLWPNRRLRVLGLLVALVVLSAVDLWMTLLHMTSGGMLEANAIVRYLASEGSPALLAWWKLWCVVPFVVIMYSRRHHRNAELASLAACIVLGLVTWRWVGYNDVLLAQGLSVLEQDNAARYLTAIQ